MKRISIILILIPAIFFLSCGSSGVGGSSNPPTPTENVANLIKKSWSANSITWDGVEQYQKTSSANLVSGYAGFKLDLSVSGVVKLTEFDGSTYAGTYTISSDQNTLKLANLTSSSGVPSGTNGAIDFTIVSKPTSAGAMTLETTATYIKASNKKVKLELVSP